MRRLFWVALGATVGALVVHKVTKAAQAYTPSGVASGVGEGLAAFGEGLRELADVVREGMAEREAELRYALGIDTGTLSKEGEPMSSDQARALIDDPTGPRAPA